MNEYQERNKTLKNALANVFGYKNVSVKSGTGTARSWVNIYVYVDEDKIKETYETAREIIKNSGVKFSHYVDDMNFDHEEYILQVYSKEWK